MIFKTARFAFIAIVASVLPNECGRAATPDPDLAKRLVALTTLDRDVERNGAGDLIQLAQARNRPPEVKEEIDDQTIREGNEFRFTILPDRFFRDRDGDPLTITVRENVDWLSFRRRTQTLSGTPDAFDAPAVVRVTATDDDGARVGMSFRVRINKRNARAGRSGAVPNRNDDLEAPSRRFLGPAGLWRRDFRGAVIVRDS